MISARIVERGSIRYTPAGLPALDVVLRHEGQASENQSLRQVQVEIKAKAVGEILVRQLQVLELGSPAVYTGFLAAARNGRGIVFHLDSMVPDEAPDAAPDAKQPIEEHR
jgi:primosomal replication protein N